MVLVDTDIMVDIIRRHSPAVAWLDSAYYLSHGLGILDALIAETAAGMNTELATFNTKHYGVVATLQTFQPYARE